MGTGGGHCTPQVQDLYPLYLPRQRGGLCHNFKQTTLTTRLYKVRTNLYTPSPLTKTFRRARTTPLLTDISTGLLFCRSSPVLLTLAASAAQGLCIGRVSVRPSVRPSVCTIDQQQQRRPAGLLLGAVRAGYIDRKLRAPCCRRVGAQQQMRVASCSEPTKEA